MNIIFPIERAYSNFTTEFTSSIVVNVAGLANKTFGITEFQIINEQPERFIEQIKSTYPAFKLIVGGNLNSKAKIESLLRHGVDQVVIGRHFDTNRQEVGELSLAHPGRIVVSVGLRNGMVDHLMMLLKEQLEFVRHYQVDLLLVNEQKIARECGVSIDHLRFLGLLKANGRIIYSGGISCEADLTKLKDAGINNCIIGTYYYQRMKENGAFT